MLQWSGKPTIDPTMEKILDSVERKLHNLGEDVELNEMLGCELRGKGRLWLHVSEFRDRSFGQKLRLLREGFSNLAYLLKEEPEFSKVDTISATSWIVTKNPGLLKRLGFTVDNNAEGFEESKKEYGSKHRIVDKETKDIEPGYAYISKAKFLELYGQ